MNTFLDLGSVSKMPVKPEVCSNKMPWVDGTTRVFGVIAHPIDHVRAPMVFNPSFAQRGLPHVMVPIDAPPEHLEAVIRGLRAMPNFGGLAVTVPHKLALAGLCDYLGTAAQLTGAVNAIRFDPDGKIYGDNFDGAGFVAGCLGNGFEITDRNILVIGAGGAARAIAAALVSSGVGNLTVVNRDPQKAQALIDALYLKMGYQNGRGLALAAIDGSGFDMIINCTSVGLKPDDDLPLALDRVNPDTVIADIIMVPAETRWLTDAKSMGLTVHYGRHMLDYQLDLIGEFIGAL